MTQPIEEFLVGLGFKIDGNSFKLFSGGVLAANSAVAKLGFSAVNTAVAVEKMVEKIARQFENLYYISELSGASVGNLQSWQYGAQQIGLTAEQATGMVTNLGLAMKANPGIEALMQGLGVHTRDAHGQLRDTKDLLDDLNGQLVKLPTYLQAAYAPLFGETLSELVLWKAHAQDAADATADFAKRQREAGIDAKQFASDSRDLDNDLRKTGSTFEIIGEQIAKFFMPSIDGAVKSVGNFFNQVSGQTPATDPWAKDLRTLGALLTEAATAADHLYATKVLLAGLKTAPATMTAGVVVAATAVDTVASYINEPEVEPEKGAGTLGRALMRMGWSRANAASIAANLMAESGGNARIPGDYVHGKPTAYGLAQWHAKRQQDFARIFGHDIQKSTADEQLKFVTWELTQGPYKNVGAKLKNLDAEAGASLLSSDWEAPRDKYGEMEIRARHAKDIFNTSLGSSPTGGGGGVVVNQKTDIHVTPGPTATETATKVADLQSTVNSRLVRNRAYAAQ